MTNEGTPSLGEPFFFPCYKNIGPPYIATLSLPGLTIGLPVWLFSTQVILNVASDSVVLASEVTPRFLVGAEPDAHKFLCHGLIGW
jgi:hypothetical protein